MIYSLADFERMFGPSPCHDGGSEMLDQVKMFFTNGGSMAYILRLDEGVLSSIYPFHWCEEELEDFSFNIIVVPKMHAEQSDKERQAIYKAANKFAQEHRAFLIMDPPYVWGSVADTANLDLTGCHIEGIQECTAPENAAVYWPRLKVAAEEPGTHKYIGPSGAIAGLMARTDTTRGIWKAPAGLEADIRGIMGLEHAMTNEENGVLNKRGINAIRAFPSGIVSWGARTLAGHDVSDNEDYKYISVRRLSLMIEDSLSLGLQFTEHEQNDEELWAQVRLAAGSFMHNLFRQGAFQGQKTSDAYFVKIDDTTTSDYNRLGIARLIVGFAPIKPSEFVTITLSLKTSLKETHSMNKQEKTPTGFGEAIDTGLKESCDRKETGAHSGNFLYPNFRPIGHREALDGLKKETFWIRSVHLEYFYGYAVVEEVATGHRFVLTERISGTTWSELLRFMGARGKDHPHEVNENLVPTDKVTGRGEDFGSMENSLVLGAITKMEQVDTVRANRIYDTLRGTGTVDLRVVVNGHELPASPWLKRLSEFVEERANAIAHEMMEAKLGTQLHPLLDTLRDVEIMVRDAANKTFPGRHIDDS